jgi:fatty acid desaturase
MVTYKCDSIKIMHFAVVVVVVVVAAAAVIIIIIIIIVVVVIIIIVTVTVAFPMVAYKSEDNITMRRKVPVNCTSA